MMENNIRVLGLLGEHIENSLSPFIHQSFINYYQINYVYLPFQITQFELEEVIKSFKESKMRGFNVTNPFKEKVIKFLDDVDRSAADIGAINTVVQKDGKLYGYNTDWSGFQRPLQDGLSFNFVDKRVIVLGAGGAARAIIYALINGGCSEISVFNRNYKNALAIKNSFQKKSPGCQIEVFSSFKKELEKKINCSDLLVNTTPLGSWYYPDSVPFPESVNLPSSLIVYDLIYYPDKTLFLKRAEKNGNRFLNGKAMLVYQAAKSFFLWTGIEPEQGLIDEILNKI